jgi:transcriptional regulator with XRE-family HTH domain
MRLLRRRNLLTQHGLAAKSGVSQGTIARIESGARTELRVGTMKALAEALGVQPDEVTEFRPSLGLPPAE